MRGRASPSIRLARAPIALAWPAAASQPLAAARAASSLSRRLAPAGLPGRGVVGQDSGCGLGQLSLVGAADPDSLMACGVLRRRSFGVGKHDPKSLSIIYKISLVISLEICYLGLCELSWIRMCWLRPCEVRPARREPSINCSEKGPSRARRALRCSSNTRRSCAVRSTWRQQVSASDEVALILDELAAILRPVVPYFQWRPMLSDPDDERVFETAINGQVDVLMTFNVRDYFPAAQRFDLEVLRPGEFLRRL